MAYILEALGESQLWEMVMKHQRKNGSLFNSPATTAAAFTHLKDSSCLKYLCSLLDKFGDAGSSVCLWFICSFSYNSDFSDSLLVTLNLFYPVPTVDPLDIYVRLSIVDTLERLGIGRHFREEIRSVLDETYR